MNCIAIDDEPLALNIIEDFCSKIEYLNMVGKFTSAFDALETINTQKVSLVFCDIQMPDVNGLEFVKSMVNPPMVIFTTAYSDYAVEGFDVSAIDYLVKPVPFNRFFKAVNKAYELFNLRNAGPKNNNTPTDTEEPNDVAFKEQENSEFILIKVEYSTVRIDLKNVMYIEGLKDYIKIYTLEKMYLTKSTMKNILGRLPNNLFIRVHKSYIVAKGYIRMIENNRIIINNKYIPIGEQFKDEFYKYINKNRI